MNVNQLLEEHAVICGGARSIMQAKNHDYTDGSQDLFKNFRSAEMVGVLTSKGILVRLLDKISRLNTLSSGKELQVGDEKLVDTIRDAINYLILFKVLIDEEATPVGVPAEALLDG